LARKRQDNRIVFDSLFAEMASRSILDDAIREHLELKRAHGADEAEIKRLEDEAFGPPGRPDEPDPQAEAPTEFLTAPEAGAEAAEESGRRINIADLQEAPPEPAESKEEPRIEVTESVEPQADAAPLAPAEDPAQAAPPVEEGHAAIDAEAVPDVAPEAPAEPVAPEPAAEVAEPGHSTEERHAIADQPTEFFDVEAEMGTEDAPAAEIEASRSEAPAPPAADEDEEDDEFWSDQRLSEELDNALEAPLTDEHDAPAAPVPVTDEHDIPAPTVQPVAPLFDQDKKDEEPAREERPEHGEFEPETGHEDVLEDTPDFLEDAPEDDELWFEQRPPKDFDFDD
jgi:hypothetical protein